MDARDDYNLEAPFSAAEATELLNLFGDQSDRFFEMDFASLLDSEYDDAMASIPPALASSLEDSSLQFESSTTLVAHAQSEESEPRSSLETAKTKSTFQRQKEELANLRSKIAELEAQLNGLRARDRLSTSSSTEDTNMLDQTLRGTAASLSLWKVVANRQLSERNRAETENLELRKSLREQAGLVKSLKKMLRRRLVPLKLLEKPNQRQIVEVCEQDSEVIQALLCNIEERLRSVDSIFEEHGFTTMATNVNSTRVVPSDDDQDVYVEFLNARKVAADLQVLSSTIWTLLSSRELTPDGQSLRVVKFTDEVLVMKQVMQSPSCAGTLESTVMLSVLKRVTQAHRVLLLWECLIERTGTVGGGERSPVEYLSQYGCVQISRADDSDPGGRPASLAHSYTRLTPIQMTPVHLVDPAQTHPIVSKAGLDMMIALCHHNQHNQHNFLQFIETELEGVVQDMNQVQI